MYICRKISYLYKLIHIYMYIYTLKSKVFEFSPGAFTPFSPPLSNWKANIM